jgi:hypothetical protein
MIAVAGQAGHRDHGLRAERRGGYAPTYGTASRTSTVVAFPFGRV